MNVTKLILICSNLPILIAAVYALCVYRNLRYTLKIFTWFIFLTVGIQVPYLILWFQGKNNLPLLHVYVLLGFISLSLFYRQMLQHFIQPAIIYLLITGFSCFTIINSLAIQNIWAFNSNALTVMSVLMVILSLFTFVILLNDTVKEIAGDILTSIRWINSGIFIYYASSLLLFYFASDIMKAFSVTLNRYTWILNSFFLTVMYTCFIIGLWKRQKTLAF
jgi:hypothetical protein